MRKIKNFLGKKAVRITLLAAGIICTAGVIFVFISYFYIDISAKKYLVSDKLPEEQMDAIIILGAFVQNGYPCPMLEDRLKKGYDLYKDGAAPKILITGDHLKEDYDEINVMREYLLNLGISAEDILEDPLGLNTYASLYRAKSEFGIKTAVVVSQDFHVRRAIFIGNGLGIKTYGVSSDLRKYGTVGRSYAREFLSRPKAVFEVITRPKPYSGNQ